MNENKADNSEIFLKNKIEKLVKDKSLRNRSVDKERIKSIINSAIKNANVTLSFPLNENNATVIFREIYESLRQLGDARWWILGYEPRDHDTSLDALTTLDIKDKVKLNFLDRYKKIRNDINYRGFTASLSQAKEITDLWKSYSNEITSILSGEIKPNEKSDTDSDKK